LGYYCNINDRNNVGVKMLSKLLILDAGIGTVSLELLVILFGRATWHHWHEIAIA